MDGVGRNANHGAATSLLHLPADVLREFIFFHLSVPDIIKLAHTSVRLRDLVRAEQTWKQLFKNLRIVVPDSVLEKWEGSWQWLFSDFWLVYRALTKSLDITFAAPLLEIQNISKKKASKCATLIATYFQRKPTINEFVMLDLDGYFVYDITEWFENNGYNHINIKTTRFLELCEKIVCRSRLFSASTNQHLEVALSCITRTCTSAPYLTSRCTHTCSCGFLLEIRYV